MLDVDKFKEEVLGYTSDERMEDLINTKARRARSINNSIDREFEALGFLIEDLINNDDGSGEFTYSLPIYNNAKLSKNTRATMLGKINPQTSKFFRPLMSYKKDAVVANLNNTKDVEQLKLSIAAGFGITPEKNQEEKAIKEYEAKIKEPVITKALKVINSMQEGIQLNDAAQTILFDAIKEAGTGTHGLASLMTLARLQSNTGSEFKYNLFREADGITNGMAITLLQYATNF